eukprot:3921524-Pyramimonas_sp.AAC.1
MNPPRGPVNPPCGPANPPGAAGAGGDASGGRGGGGALLRLGLRAEGRQVSAPSLPFRAARFSAPPARLAAYA